MGPVIKTDQEVRTFLHGKSGYDKLSYAVSAFRIAEKDAESGIEALSQAAADPTLNIPGDKRDELQRLRRFFYTMAQLIDREIVNSENHE